MSISRLSAFQAYDYYNTSGAQRDLTPEETDYHQFCMDNHETICSENTDNNDPIILEASQLYMNIFQPTYNYDL